MPLLLPSLLLLALAQAEADAFWCLSRLLDSVHDNYTFAQPGIQRMVFKLKELAARADAKRHLIQ